MYMALVNSSSSVVLPQSPFLSPFTKLRTTTTSRTAINAHASSSITKHPVMIKANIIHSFNIRLIKHHHCHHQKSSSSFSSTSLVVKSLKNGQEPNSSVAAVPPPAPGDQIFEEDDPLITKTNSTSTTAIDAPLVPLVSHDVLKRSDFPVDFMFGAGSSWLTADHFL